MPVTRITKCLPLKGGNIDLPLKNPQNHPHL